MPSLPDLPTELLMEIVKYYPDLHLYIDASIRGVYNDEFSGNDTLRALSQTCRTLRGIFLPVLWERVHACFTVRNLPRKIKRRAKMLERRMIGIQKTVYILPYIQSLTVTLEECHMGNWQPMAQFIRVLQLLPDLRILTIIRAPGDMASVFLTSIYGKAFPSVVSLTIQSVLAPILRCFPNLETLTCQDPYCTKLLEGAKDCCENIHTVNNISLVPQALNCLREMFPRVRRLSIWRDIRLDGLALLEGMDDLSDLRIRYSPPRNHFYAEWQRPPPLDEVITAAKRILRTSKTKRQKELRIQHLVDNISVDKIEEEQIFIVGGGQ
ncbi:hypothetical protein FB451DRAFT_1215295 [Mycena latifolia]|nr:hypothetical protein FB451DRAFT_1215295 [Mycena latifolia]